MSLKAESNQACNEAHTVPQHANMIREHFGMSNSLFDELKSVAVFIYNLGTKLDLSTEQTRSLKEKIEALCLVLNESAIQTANRVSQGFASNINTSKVSLLDETTANTTRVIPYEELYVKYNDALKQVVELTADITEISNNFNNLQDKFQDQQHKTQKLMKEIVTLQHEKLIIELEQKIRDGQIQKDEESKENHQIILDEDAVLADLLLDSTAVASSLSVNDETVKTVDDFIETFDEVLNNADEVVQLIKQLIQTNNHMKEIYSSMALAKSRMLRQVISDVLAVFRKARVKPTVLDKSMSSKVANELKLIYQTLKAIKVDIEKRPKAANIN